MAYWPSRYSLWLSWNQAFHQWFWGSQQLITWATGDINVKPKVLKPNPFYSNQPSKVSPVPQGSSKTGFSTRGQISIYVKIVREMTVFSLCCDFTRFLVGRFRWRQKQILPFFNPASNQNKRYSKDDNNCKWKLCKKSPFAIKQRLASSWSKCESSLCQELAVKRAVRTSIPKWMRV